MSSGRKIMSTITSVHTADKFTFVCNFAEGLQQCNINTHSKILGAFRTYSLGRPTKGEGKREKRFEA